ncbi:MAG TPA: outer membrane lipoprotein-sorting protein [Blastocatellia bacterium]|nr:outer membrane lipoprotein-sorting protein [Blastocatellia bacterium]
MKRIVLIVFAILCAATLAWSTAPTPANGDLDQILAKMQQAGRTVKTMQANLAFRKRNTVLGGDEADSGWFKIQRVGQKRDLVRIKYNSGTEVLLDESWGYLYQPTIHQVTKRSRSSLSGGSSELTFLETPYRSMADLKAHYDITHRGEESVASRETSVIELTPKKGTPGPKLVVWVDRSSWLPIQYEMIERSSKRTFTLTDMKINLDLGKDVFKLNPPAGTKWLTAP